MTPEIFMQTIAVILQIVSVIAADIAVAGYLDTRKKYTMEKGAREQELRQLKDDMKNAHDKIRTLEGSSQTSQINTAEIKKDIEYIKAGQDKMEKSIGELRDLLMDIKGDRC